MCLHSNKREMPRGGFLKRRSADRRAVWHQSGVVQPGFVRDLIDNGVSEDEDRQAR